MTQKFPLTELGVRTGLSSSWGPEMVALNPRLNPSALQESKPPEDLCRFSRPSVSRVLTTRVPSIPACRLSSAPSWPQTETQPPDSFPSKSHSATRSEEALVLGRRAQNHIIHVGMFKAPLSLTQAHPRQPCVRDFTVLCVSVPEGWLDYRLSKTCPPQEGYNLFF